MGYPFFQQTKLLKTMLQWKMNVGECEGIKLKAWKFSYIYNIHHVLILYNVYYTVVYKNIYEG